MKSKESPSVGTVTEVRKECLKHLVVIFKTKQRLSAASSVSPAQISQIVNDHRRMGEQLARKFEKELGLPLYAMDDLAQLKSYTDGTPLAERLEARPKQLAMQLSMEGLTALQNAALTALRDAMLKGSYSDQDCVVALQRSLSSSAGA